VPVKVTDTDEYRALCRTVLDHPTEDVPRLVLADYLEENGEPTYAEFIRTQIEAANTDKCCDTCRSLIGGYGCARCSLACRAGELWASVVGVWDFGCFGGRYETDGFVVQPSFHTFRDEPRAFRLHRGFIDEVKCPLDWWVGPTCRSCGGEGEEVVYSGHKNLYRKCRNCHGTGRGTANGPKVVRDHPVTKLTLTDNDGWVFMIHVGFSRTTTGYNEDVVEWRPLSELRAFDPDDRLRLPFDDSGEIGEAVSDVLLDWARKEAAK
jgi:uncharacterized protein (TIGR02996 family)